MNKKEQAYVEELETRMAELRTAANGIVDHMEGRQQVRGWLRDNGKSRDALNVLVKLLNREES